MSKNQGEITHLLLNRVDSNIQSGVIPLHFLFLIHLNHLGTAVSRADSNHTKNDHEQKESNTHNDDGRHSKVWKMKNEVENAFGI